jgi:hypothetical protein
MNVILFTGMGISSFKEDMKGRFAGERSLFSDLL